MLQRDTGEQVRMEPKSFDFTELFGSLSVWPGRVRWFWHYYPGNRGPFLRL